MNDRNNLFTLIFPYLLGVLMGAGIALLIAPKSGQETRSLIRHKGIEIKDRAVDTVEDTRSRASQAIGDLAQQTKDNLSSLVNRGQEMAEEKTAMIRDEVKSF